MNTSSAPKSLKSAANLIITAAALYIIMMGAVVGMSDQPPDLFGIIFALLVFGLGVLLIISAILLYKKNRAGRLIWWICSPFVLLQFPIGTLLGVFAIIYILKPESREALSPSIDAGQAETLKP